MTTTLLEGHAELGQRIRSLRKQAGWSLLELSQKSGLALGTLSKLENGKAGSNLKTHQKLAGALGIALTDLYQGVPALGGDTVAISPTSQDVETFAYDGKNQAVLLAKQVMDKRMLPQMVILEPGGKTHKEQLRPGTERWVFLLEGAIEVTVEDNHFPLKRYGTLYFKASLPHQLTNTGKTTAKCISVTSPVGL